MRRVRHPPRPDFAARAAELGFAFHSIDGAPYWVEDAHYAFTEAEIDTIEDATASLEELCIEAVDRLVKDGGGYHLFGLADLAIQLIEASWRNRHRHVYGRMDLAYDGSGGPPKLLEYNADTPTALFEASVVQWEWLQSFAADAQQEGGPDQFNSIHEKLVAAWQAYGIEGVLHFTSIGPGLAAYLEDRGTTEYMRDTAHQAGLETRLLDIEAIGWDGRSFVDADGRAITSLWKLYPWEWLVREEYGPLIPQSRCLFIEPAWKMLLSNKAILPVLWQMFPDHPNLLPAFFEPGRSGGPEVSKPILGREGANVTLPGQPETAGEYGDQPKIFQASTRLFQQDGQFAVVGSWSVAGQPAGIGMREDVSPVTTNASRFVPHLFR